MLLPPESSRTTTEWEETQSVVSAVIDWMVTGSSPWLIRVNS